MIENDCVVSFNFSLTDDDGNVLETSAPGKPMVYLHGAGNLLPGLEKGLKGMKVGEKETITVYPEEGFGEVISELKVKVPRAEFPAEINLEKGRVLESEQGGKKQRYRIVGLDQTTVYLDGNHPMAGKTLHYAVDVVQVRPATEAEIDKGQPMVDSGSQN